MRPVHLAALLSALTLPACTQFAVKADVGYTSMAISGDLALSPTGGGASISQDLDSGFGLGDPSGSPYLRAELDLGTPVLAVSAFQFSDSGVGRLQGSFGNISGGTDVATDLDFRNVKTSLTFDIDLGPARLAPGLAIDLFDLDMRVQDLAGFVEERLELLGPVPLLLLRGEADLGPFTGVAELGGIIVPEIQDIEGTFWDAEFRVELRASTVLHLFAGYRFIHIDGEGTVDDQDFDTSLDISGWLIGGGVRF